MLLSGGHGIHFVTTPEEATRRIRVIDGQKYTRFMDFIYLPVATHLLSEEQVVVVNTLRHKYRRRLDLSENIRVRSVMLSAVAEVRPMFVVEMGSGFFPLYSAHEDFQFRCSDLNGAAVQALRGRGYQAFDFSPTQPVLPLPDNTVDVVVAVFVLHFAVSGSQFGEVNRLLNDGGLLIANVYRRGRRAQEKLKAQLDEFGLHVAIVVDPSSRRRVNQFWVAGRSVEVVNGTSEYVRRLLIRP